MRVFHNRREQVRDHAALAGLDFRRHRHAGRDEFIATVDSDVGGIERHMRHMRNVARALGLCIPRVWILVIGTISQD